MITMSRFTLNVSAEGAIFLGKIVTQDAELFHIGSTDTVGVYPGTLAHDLADHAYAHRHDTSRVTVEQELSAIGASIARRPYDYDGQHLASNIADVTAYAVYRQRSLAGTPHIQKQRIQDAIDTLALSEHIPDIIEHLQSHTDISETAAKEYVEAAIKHVALGYLRILDVCKDKRDPEDRYHFIYEMAQEALETVRRTGCAKLVCIYDTPTMQYSFKTHGEIL